MEPRTRHGNGLSSHDRSQQNDPQQHRSGRQFSREYEEPLGGDVFEERDEFMEQERYREQGRGRSPYGGQSFEDQAAGRRSGEFGGASRRRRESQGELNSQAGGAFGTQYYGPQEREDFGYMGGAARSGSRSRAPFSETQSRRSRQDFAYGDPMEDLDFERGTSDLDFAPHGSQGHRGRGPKGYRRSDDRILEDVNERLTQHDRIDASEIEVRVEQGEVTLSGTVDGRTAKRLAEDVAEGVSGVTDVQNNIRVRREGRENPTSSTHESHRGQGPQSSKNTASETAASGRKASS